MSADEFWKDDPQLFVSYRTSFINKTKRKAEEEDYKRWLQGLYIYDGNSKINASLKQFLGNMFSEKKDRTKIDVYPSKPYIELENERKYEKDLEIKKNKELKNEYENSLVYFGSIKQRYLENKKNKQ